MTTTKPHFGVTLPQIKRPWVAAAEAARGFESLGFDSLWVCDHLYRAAIAATADSGSLVDGFSRCRDHRPCRDRHPRYTRRHAQPRTTRQGHRYR